MEIPMLDSAMPIQSRDCFRIGRASFNWREKYSATMPMGTLMKKMVRRCRSRKLALLKFEWVTRHAG
ncbi:hypothetical protein [Burkholderia sp. MSMB1589WGS]|uniref:hypothetical protein n=1 Tax=Burkholderia sp. MSMB1589WGS TaxID=1636425 RepID=UPI0012E6F490|nr:hypothetical protein [Burkholderia sp. MSMB1589WGS]